MTGHGYHHHWRLVGGAAVTRAPQGGGPQKGARTTPCTRKPFSSPHVDHSVFGFAAKKLVDGVHGNLLRLWNYKKRAILFVF